MPNGKRAGERCVQLAEDHSCKLFGRPDRPAFCGTLQPSIEMCGASRDAALLWLSTLEQDTRPTN